MGDYSKNAEYTLSLREKVPVFFKYLEKIAKALKINGYSYLDNHCLYMGPKNLKYINMCFTLDEKDEFIPNDAITDYNCSHPTSWIFPGDHKCYQCKNNLYLGKDNQVYLTTCSTGADLTMSLSEKMFDGEIVTQSRWLNKQTEINFKLPVDVFVNLILCKKELEVLSIWREYVMLKRIAKIRIIQRLWLDGHYYNPKDPICINRMHKLYLS